MTQFFRNSELSLIFVFLLITGGISSCEDETASESTSEAVSVEDSTSLDPDRDPETPIASMGESFPDSVHGNPLLSPLEQSLRDAGLTNIQEIDPTIRVSLAYSTTDNFLNADVYGELVRCYVQPEVSEMLAVASSCVQEADSSLRLLVFDGVRPRSVQRIMWDIVKGTDQQKYVANPSGGGGMHNYGCAVDLGLHHVDTGLVDMGTPFDFFGDLAQPRYEVDFVRQGRLKQVHLDNRRKLRACMLEAGFSGILSEWWHFNAFPKEVARQRYQIVE